MQFDCFVLVINTRIVFEVKLVDDVVMNSVNSVDKDEDDIAELFCMLVAIAEVNMSFKAIFVVVGLVVVRVGHFKIKNSHTEKVY